MKKYGNILDLALPYLCGPWDLEKFRILPLYMGLRTWKKFHAQAPSWTLGFEKMLSFPFLRLQSVGEAPRYARCEVSLFCLLHISSKLFPLTYSSKVFGEVTSPNTSREHTTRKLIVVDVLPPPFIGFGTWTTIFLD